MDVIRKVKNITSIPSNIHPISTLVKVKPVVGGSVTTSLTPTHPVVDGFDHI